MANIAFGSFALLRLLGTPANTSAAASATPRIRAPYYAASLEPGTDTRSLPGLIGYAHSHPANQKTLGVFNLDTLAAYEEAHPSESINGCFITTMVMLPNNPMVAPKDSEIMMHGLRWNDASLLNYQAVCDFGKHSKSEIAKLPTPKIIVVTGRYAGRNGNSINLKDCKVL